MLSSATATQRQSHRNKKYDRLTSRRDQENKKEVITSNRQKEKEKKHNHEEHTREMDEDRNCAIQNHFDEWKQHHPGATKNNSNTTTHMRNSSRVAGATTRKTASVSEPNAAVVVVPAYVSLLTSLHGAKLPMINNAATTRDLSALFPHGVSEQDIAWASNVQKFNRRLQQKECKKRKRDALNPNRKIQVRFIGPLDADATENATAKEANKKKDEANKRKEYDRIYRQKNASKLSAQRKNRYESKKKKTKITERRPVTKRKAVNKPKQPKKRKQVSIRIHTKHTSAPKSTKLKPVLQQKQKTKSRVVSICKSRCNNTNRTQRKSVDSTLLSSSSSSSLSSSKFESDKDVVLLDEEDDDDDDDDVIIVTNEQLLESSRKVTNIISNDDNNVDEDNDDIDNTVRVLGSIGINALSDFCHLREDCVTVPFGKTNTASSLQHQLYCAQCFCYVCDVKASACTAWNNNHCFATRRDIKWQRRRSKVRCKKNAPERALQRLHMWSSSSSSSSLTSTTMLEQQERSNILSRRKRRNTTTTVNYCQYY